MFNRTKFFKSSCSLVAILLITSFFLGSVPVAYAETPTIQASSVYLHTNVERYKEGLPLLKTNDALSKVARQKMLDLFARQYFAHEAPTGESVSDLAKSNGYSYILVGENLAMGDFASSRAVVTAWMNSPGHRKNILSKAYTEIGIAAGKGMYQGRNIWMVVQSFGTPQTTCPSISDTMKAKVKTYENRLSSLVTIAEKRKSEIANARTTQEKKERIDSYNRAARLYNETVAEYEEFVGEYNSQVDAYNKCVKKVIAKAK